MSLGGDVLTKDGEQDVGVARLAENRLRLGNRKLRVGARHHNDRNVPQVGVGGHLAQNRFSPQAGKVEIEDDCIRTALLDRRERRDAIGGKVYIESAEAHRMAIHLSEGSVILDEEDAGSTLTQP